MQRVYNLLGDFIDAYRLWLPRVALSATGVYFAQASLNYDVGIILMRGHCACVSSRSSSDEMPLRYFEMQLLHLAKAGTTYLAAWPIWPRHTFSQKLP